MYKWVRDRSVSGIALSFSVERRLGVCLETNREGNFRGQRRRSHKPNTRRACFKIHILCIMMMIKKKRTI